MVEIVGGGTPDTSNPEFWNGEVDWYSPTEIGEKIYANGSNKTITYLGLEKSSAKLLPAHKTILFTSRASIGDMAILIKAGATNQGFQSFIVNDEMDIYFLYSMGSKIKEFALKNASGSTFLEISKNELGKMDIFIPPTKAEQQAIGEFFKQLDDTIAFHQRTQKKYQNLKKSYLEKMFAKINYAWKQRKLGEVLLVRNEFAEQHYFKIDIELENLEPETGRLIGDLSIRTKTNSIFKKGDILFGRLRPYLKKWHLAQTNGLKSGEIWAFYSTDEFCRNFIYLLVQTENFLKIANISAGTKMPRADWNLISQMSISVPTLAEQQAIGEFFKQLDDTIAFHQRELEKYQQLKQVLLDQLFV